MKDLLNLEVSFFLLIGAGCLVKRLRIVDGQGEKSIINLVLLVVLPCNIFNSFMTDVSADLIGDGLWVLGISVMIQLGAVVFGKIAFRGEPDARSRNLRYAMICSNAGFLGNPLAEGIFGPTGLMLASIYLIPQRIMMWSEGLAIFSGNRDPRIAARKVLTHPCVIACFLGIAVMLTGVSVPRIILTPIQIIAKCNTALSMMVIGMILAEIDPHMLVDKTVVWFTFHRLVGFPLVIYLVCLLLPVSPVVRGLSVLLAAMPAGATTTMLAAKTGQDPCFATRLVVFSTLCSIPAVMIWGMILRA